MAQGSGTGFSLYEMGIWLWSQGPQTPHEMERVSSSLWDSVSIQTGSQEPSLTKARLKEPSLLSSCQGKALATAGWFGGEEEEGLHC